MDKMMLTLPAQEISFQVSHSTTALGKVNSKYTQHLVTFD
jgi:hypothetical protein